MAQTRILVFAAIAGTATLVLAQKPVITQQDKINQTLNIPKDPPLVAIGETSHLEFHVSPLSGKGLLSEQTRDALKAIQKLNGGVPILHVRAFSAGNGDVRRIPQIVADVLGGKNAPLPSVSVIQAGALTVDDAQVVLETISAGKKEVNKDGLTFLPAETAASSDPESPIKPLLQKAMDQLAAKMTGAPLAVTCFVSNLQNPGDLISMVKNRFATVAIDLVQPRRVPLQTEASCEGVSRGGAMSSRMAFTGTQVAFGMEEKDAALAVQRMDRALGEAGGPPTAQAMLVRFYALSPAAGELAVKQVPGARSKTVLNVEAVASASAGFALDAVAPVR